MITHHRVKSSNVLLCVTYTSWNLAENCIMSCFKSHMEILTTQCINGLLKFLEKSNLHLFSEFHILSRFCIKCPVSSSDDVWGWKWRGRFHFSFATRTRVNWFISDGESHWNTNKSTIKKKRRNRDENRNAGKKTLCSLSWGRSMQILVPLNGWFILTSNRDEEVQTLPKNLSIFLLIFWVEKKMELRKVH